MIDVCLAFQYGAAMIMVDNDIRCAAPQLLDTIFPSQSDASGVTIMQTTPSLFSRWPPYSIKDRIFNGNSCLRILAFGGEKFPALSYVCEWSDWAAASNHIRIFNLYGLTEMSCWSSIHEITRDEILHKKEIPIGKPLDEYTIFTVNGKNDELLIKSNIRKCYQPILTDNQIFDDNFEFVLHTGDKVRSTNDGEIYFQSRLNSIVKFYGQKIDLSNIETLAKSLNFVIEAVCVHDPVNNAIVLLVKMNEDELFEDFHKHITKALVKINVRIKIVPIKNFPLTEHGKINRILLQSEIQSIKCGKLVPLPIQSLFIQIINEALGSNIEPLEVEKDPNYESSKKLKTDNDLSFVFLGGSSLKAVQIVDEIEKITSKSISKLLPMLLNEQFTINDILSHLSECDNDESNFSHGAQQLKHCWCVNFEKCIDATPTICKLKNNEMIVSVGSHSKLLLNILISNGKILSRIELPDRIESQVTQLNELNGVVGCYDGYLYCFDFITGHIRWKFNSEGMIKCRTLITGSLAIFGNYNPINNLWCVNVDNGELVWHQRIGTKSIFANPVELNAKSSLACCLDGNVSAVEISSKELQWTFDAGSPIFSSPLVLEGNDEEEILIIIAAVNGTIFCLNDTGVQISSYRIVDNIFASLGIWSIDEKLCFVFGTQNHFLYCLNFDRRSNRYEEIWKRGTDSSIRSTPVIWKRNDEEFILNVTTAGSLEVIACATGQMMRNWIIDGPVFSSPVIWQQNLIVGSRNNFLYCFGLDNIVDSR